MIPPVPFYVRLVLAAICIAIMRTAMALADWFVPEFADERDHHDGDASEPKR